MTEIHQTPKRTRPTSNANLLLACFRRQPGKPVAEKFLTNQTGLEPAQIQTAWQYLIHKRKLLIEKHSAGGSTYFVFRGAKKADQPKLGFGDVFKMMDELGAA